MQNQKLKKNKVLSNTEIAPKLFSLKFKRDFEFKAGQIIGITLNPEEPRRLYSIASGEQEDDVEILYNRVDDGKFTPHLSDVKARDTIYISRASGKFLFNGKPAFWIATGTGIAPYVSMLKTNLSIDAILVHGCRLLSEFTYRDFFLKKLGGEYVRCCTQEESDEVYYGRVTTYLKELDNLPLDRDYYLCGNTEMVVEARDILLSKNIPIENIIAEIYF